MWLASTKKARAPLKDLKSALPFPQPGAESSSTTPGFWFALADADHPARHHDPADACLGRRSPPTTFFVGSIILFFGLPAGAGLLSQIIGRRTAITLFGALALILVGGTLLYYLPWCATRAERAVRKRALPSSITILFYVLVVSPWGFVTTYISERFPTHVRASGYGIGYSVGGDHPGLRRLLPAVAVRDHPYLFPRRWRC